MKIKKLTLSILSLGILFTGCGSSLSQLARDGDLKSVKEKISQGTNINEKYTAGGGWTALIGASSGNNFEMVEYLVNSGANINIVDDDKDTALFSAASNKNKNINLKIVKYLVAKGAKINIVNYKGYSPLLKAAKAGNIEIIKFLIKNGANINVRTRDHQDVISLLVMYGYKYTIKEDILTIVKFLVNKGVSVNNKYYLNQTLLHMSEDVELSKYLVTLGLSVNALTTDNMTPLMVGLLNYDRKIDIKLVEFLIKKCTNLDIKDNKGRTALYLAKMRGFKNIANLIHNTPVQCQSKKNIKKIIIPK